MLNNSTKFLLKSNIPRSVHLPTVWPVLVTPSEWNLELLPSDTTPQLCAFTPPLFMQMIDTVYECSSCGAELNPLQSYTWKFNRWRTLEVKSCRSILLGPAAVHHRGSSVLLHRNPVLLDECRQIWYFWPWDNKVKENIEVSIACMMHGKTCLGLSLHSGANGSKDAQQMTNRLSTIERRYGCWKEIHADWGRRETFFCLSAPVSCSHSHFMWTLWVWVQPSSRWLCRMDICEQWRKRLFERWFRWDHAGHNVGSTAQIPTRFVSSSFEFLSVFFCLFDSGNRRTQNWQFPSVLFCLRQVVLQQWRSLCPMPQFGNSVSQEVGCFPSCFPLPHNAQQIPQKTFPLSCSQPSLATLKQWPQGVFIQVVDLCTRQTTNKNILFSLRLVRCQNKKEAGVMWFVVCLFHNQHDQYQILWSYRPMYVTELNCFHMPSCLVRVPIE